MLNKEEYLHDISADKPCGEYLKYDHIYDDIREAKREDDPRLPQGVWQREIKKANWKEVMNLCSDVLINKSKDLQIAAWLIEAYTSLQHWEGMFDSLDLFYELCQKYWENIYPTIEEDDLDYRLAPVASLTTRLTDLSLLIPITAPEDNIHQSYSLSSWIEARYYAKSTNSNTFHDLNESLSLTSDMFLITNEHWIQKIMNCITKLNSFLNLKTNEQSPSFSHILANLKDADTIISNVLNERRLNKWNADQDTYVSQQEQQAEISTEESEDEFDNITNVDSTSEQKVQGESDPFAKATLKQAFDALYQISNFIEQKDPQNPSSTLIRLALYLHDKTFAELVSMTTKDGEPIVTCLSKMCSILETKKFDKSIFDEDESQ